MDYETGRPEKSATEAEGILFGPTPVWERSRKRRGFGGRKTAAAEPAPRPAEDRSFAPAAAPAVAAHTPPSTPMNRPAERPMSATEDGDAGLVAPIGRPSATRAAASRDPRPSGAMTATIAAGVVAVGAMGAGAWLLMSDRQGVPELAPGSVSTEVAAAPILPPAPEQMIPAAIEPPVAQTAPPAEPPRALAARETLPTARTRPAAAPSAESAAQNASASVTLPEGPQPYTSLNPGAAATPTPVNPPMLTLPPPAPAEAPVEIPATTETVPPTNP